MEANKEAIFSAKSFSDLPLHPHLVSPVCNVPFPLLQDFSKEMKERWYVKPEVSGSSPGPVKVFFAIFEDFSNTDVAVLGPIVCRKVSKI